MISTGRASRTCCFPGLCLIGTCSTTSTRRLSCLWLVHTRCTSAARCVSGCCIELPRGTRSRTRNNMCRAIIVAARTLRRIAIARADTISASCRRTPQRGAGDHARCCAMRMRSRTCLAAPWALACRRIIGTAPAYHRRTQHQQKPFLRLRRPATAPWQPYISRSGVCRLRTIGTLGIVARLTSLQPLGRCHSVTIVTDELLVRRLGRFKNMPSWTNPFRRPQRQIIFRQLIHRGLKCTRYFHYTSADIERPVT